MYSIAANPDGEIVNLDALVVVVSVGVPQTTDLFPRRLVSISFEERTFPLRSSGEASGSRYRVLRNSGERSRSYKSR